MKTTPIDSPRAPAAAGGYTQALRVDGASTLLFISGQIPESIDGAVPSDFVAQARLVWANVVAQLEAAGLTTTNLVKVTTFLSSRDHAVANRDCGSWCSGRIDPRSRSSSRTSSIRRGCWRSKRSRRPEAHRFPR